MRTADTEIRSALDMALHAGVSIYSVLESEFGWSPDRIRAHFSDPETTSSELRDYLSGAGAIYENDSQLEDPE